MRRTLLRGIDFSKPVQVCNRLPDGIYVQFVEQHLGSWFMRTGLRPDQVGLSGQGRNRRLYKPVGAVAALESTAAAIKDYWTQKRLLESVDPRSGESGEVTRGGGTQYLVINKFQMQAVS
jgi:hypothetical protein